MSELKECPCGKFPSELCIQDNGTGWALAGGNCCAEWNVEFRTHYMPLDSKECMEYAIKAWNRAKRKEKAPAETGA